MTINTLIIMATAMCGNKTKSLSIGRTLVLTFTREKYEFFFFFRSIRNARFPQKLFKSRINQCTEFIRSCVVYNYFSQFQQDLLIELFFPDCLKTNKIFRFCFRKNATHSKFSFLHLKYCCVDLFSID